MSETENTAIGDTLDAILWNPTATVTAVESFCSFAVQHKLRAVCVNTSRVIAVAAQLADTPVRTVGLVGFPLGEMDADAKRYEAELAFDLGAQEVELVLSLGQIKGRDTKRLLRETRDVVAAADESPVGITVELAQLNADEQSFLTELVLESGAQRIVTSTDFWPDSRVNAERIAALRESVGAKLQIKAVGGLRDCQNAHALLDAGANLIGSTAVAGLV
jgi:deoxyribose-phosphate aldolase